MFRKIIAHLINKIKRDPVHQASQWYWAQHRLDPVPVRVEVRR